MPVSMLVRGVCAGTKNPVDIDIRQGRVLSVRPVGRSAADAGDAGSLILPGLFDIQVNGACGYDMQSPGMTVETVHALNACLVARGVFRWIPTLVTDSADALEHKCRVLGEALRDPLLARHIPGIHLEGPHISPEDGPRGAHPAAHVRPPDLNLFARLQGAANGHICYVTLAPEWPGAVRYIRALTARGVLVSLGHHRADASHIRAAADAGARLCTHLGNGLASLVHRHQNPLWPQLADDRLHVSLIADLEHLPPEMLNVVYRVKGPRRIVLVSDSVLLAGMKPGRHTLFGAEVEMKRSGRVCLSGTDLLAGSSLFLPEAVLNMARVTEMSLVRAVDAASRVPARLLGVRLPAWPPRPGRPVEFALYPSDSETGGRAWKPTLVFTGGVSQK